MSLLKRVWDFMLGNGTVDQEEHETEIRQRKAQIKGCNDETVANFRTMQKQFDEIELPEIPEDLLLEHKGGNHGRP